MALNTDMMSVIRAKLAGGGTRSDPRGMLGVLSRGNNSYLGAPSNRNMGPNRPAPRPGENRSIFSGQNPGLHLGQQKQGVDKRPVPALSSNNPHREAIMRRLRNRGSNPRMNASYTE